MDVTLITAIYGNYDILKPLPLGHGFVDAVCVTDDPKMSARGWRIIYEPSDIERRLASKRPRCLPWEYVNTEYSVWLDGSFQLRDARLAKLAKNKLNNFDIVAYDHPEKRKDLYEEAEYCQDWPTYRNYDIRGQTAHYRSLGMPTNSGLWETGCMARKHTKQIKQFGYEWLRENTRWSIQDQVSFPYLIWKYKINLGTWGIQRHYTPWITHRGHRMNDYAGRRINHTKVFK